MGIARSISIFTAIACLPAAVLWKALTTAYAPYNKHRSMRRILGDSLYRYIITTSVALRLEAPVGSTLDVYTKWAGKTKIPVVVDELEDGAKLLWIGEKQLDNVILFVHGGGFAVPPRESSLAFWNHVRREMEKKGVQPGIVMLSYTLWPESTFPTPLKQIQHAVQFLLTSGVHPSRVQLAGDSAGGNMIMQLVLHTLHPHPSIDPFTLPSPIKAIHLFSPWVNLQADSPSYDSNDGIDYMPKAALVWQGSRILADVPPSSLHYVDSARAPESWFAGIQGVVDSILITAGECECMRDDILQLGALLQRHHGKVEVVVQPGGFHEDMFLDFDWGTEVGILTPLIVERLVEGFR
ncbi:Alpha/Beta hydrolase protein [Roridomyces roridus]|uniref:Alpha/Beta hydrolase protein n=1 Tax=Roridomyces roridus TaxID=1738132 RepID=A0AAD7F9V3_9AGAR|nr:Alpha/Beta hydrolase protein [Roridomyces roridus]